jgi:hypothetical protein
MQPRAFLLLLLATLLAVAAAAAVTLLNPVARVGDVAPVPALPLLAERRVAPAAIEVANSLGGYRLEWRHGVEGAEGRWLLASKDDYPAETEPVQRLLAELAALRMSEPLTHDPERLARLQLEPLEAEGARSQRLRVLAEDGSLLADLFVGRSVGRLVGDSEGGTYIRLDDDAQAWLAAGRVTLPEQGLGFVDRRITTLPDDTIRRIVITHPDETVVLAERQTSDELLTVTSGLPDGTPADPAKLRRLAQLLELLSFEDVAAAAKVPFPDATVHTTVTSFDGIEVRLTLAEIDGAPWLRLSANLAEEHSAVPERKEGAERFAAELDARSEGWAFRLTEAAFDRLTVAPAELTGQ